MDKIEYKSAYDLERVKEPDILLKKILSIVDDFGEHHQISKNKKEIISVVFQYCLGYNPEEIKVSFPYLTITQIIDFLQIIEIRLGVNWVEVLKLHVLNKGMRTYSRDVIDKDDDLKEQTSKGVKVIDKYFDFINLE